MGMFPPRSMVQIIYILVIMFITLYIRLFNDVHKPLSVYRVLGGLLYPVAGVIKENRKGLAGIARNCHLYPLACREIERTRASVGGQCKDSCKCHEPCVYTARETDLFGISLSILCFYPHKS